MTLGYFYRVHHQCAYTLPEVLIATAILSFSVAAITQAIVAGQMQTYEALKQSRALALLEQLEGQVLAIEYDQLITFDGYRDGQGTNQQMQTEQGDLYPSTFQSYTRTVDVLATSMPTNFADIQAGIKVTITVQEQNGRRAWSVVRFIPEPAS